MAIYRAMSKFLKLRKILLPNVHIQRHLTRKFSLSAIKEEYPVGRQLHGFIVKQVKEIPELCLTAVRLSHEKTGADYLHVARNDKDNVFGVAFRTTPMDNTGVAHILEHISLCGSKKYPCHDPFFKMMCRSLSTFMNAFTGCSYTVYPFSTQNLADFNNLMGVYLDAAFFPKLQKFDFLQEGWRLDHETVGDSSTPIIFKGVVFNEMKGAYADSDRIYAECIQQTLLPDHTFANDSGGIPNEIPKLTYDQLKSFHKTHYHPSNARFYTYGNFSLNNHLKLIEEQILSNFASSEPDTEIPDAKRWNSPKSFSIQCQLDPLAPNPEKQTAVSVSYLLGSITDVNESFVWSLLGLLLIDGPNAPFYKSLLASNIGSGYSPLTGFSSQAKEGIFSVGLKGIHENDIQRVIDSINNTIESAIREGFPEERIQSILHAMELGLKHQTSHFGLNLLMNVTSHWNYGANPIDFLKVNEMINNFKSNMKNNPNYLQDIVKKYLQQNSHRLTLTMKGVENFEANKKLEEDNLLKYRISKLTEADRETILKDGVALREMQDQVEDVSCLPSVKLVDIEPTIEKTTVESHTLDGVSVQVCPQPTNGLIYFRCLLGTKNIDCEQKKFIPLLCHILTKMGTESMDYRQLAQKIEMKTGGLSSTQHLRYDSVNVQQHEEGIELSSYCLPQNADAMFGLWSEIFNRIDLLNVDRLRTLITDLADSLASDLSNNGHRYAMTRAASTLSYLGSLKEELSGFEQIKFMKSLSEIDDLKNTGNHLQNLAKFCLSKNHLRILINCLPEDIKDTTYRVETLIRSIPGSHVDSYFKSQSDKFESKNCRHHLVFPYPVSYVSKCYPTVPFVHEDFAKLKVLSTLMTLKFFLREIREKGGAYGGGASATAGQFAFYSYRDPKSIETLDTFDRGVEWILNSNITSSEVNEVKLPIFAEVDKPIPPSNKGSNLFLNEISDDMIQNYRNNLFRVSLTDIRNVCEKYLKNSKVCHGEVIIGNKEATADNDKWQRFTDN